jgi:hypothetical protein
MSDMSKETLVGSDFAPRLLLYSERLQDWLYAAANSCRFMHLHVLGLDVGKDALSFVDWQSDIARRLRYTRMQGSMRDA